MNAIKRILWESFCNQLWYLNRSCFCCWHSWRHHWCSNGSALQATKHFCLRPFKSCEHKSRRLAINWEKHPPCFVSAKPPGAGAASQSGIQCFRHQMTYGMECCTGLYSVGPFCCKKDLYNIVEFRSFRKSTQKYSKHLQRVFPSPHCLDSLDSTFDPQCIRLPCMISPNLIERAWQRPALDPCLPWPREALSCKNLIQGSAIGSAGCQLLQYWSCRQQNTGIVFGIEGKIPRIPNWGVVYKNKPWLCLEDLFDWTYPVDPPAIFAKIMKTSNDVTVGRPLHQRHWNTCSNNTNSHLPKPGQAL